MPNFILPHLTMQQLMALETKRLLILGILIQCSGEIRIRMSSRCFRFPWKRTLDAILRIIVFM